MLEGQRALASSTPSTMTRTNPGTTDKVSDDDDFISEEVQSNSAGNDDAVGDSPSYDDDGSHDPLILPSPTTGNITLATSLPLGDMNLMVLTDVHSWIGGHQRHESNLNADYGDVLSLYQRLKDEIRRKYKRDFFMVMNGDFMDGTGLSTTPPEYLTPLLATMPFAIINLGNHELYHEETVDWIKSQFIPHWRGHYLTSNTLWRSTKQPLGSRYVFLEGSHSTLLAFGFLYNFEGNAKNTIVEKVQDVVQQAWFLSVLARTDAYDAILVMAHMHVTDPLVEVIRFAIRQVVGPHMSIQFITGHTHIRAYVELDPHAASFEAGRFLDTIGFCSFPTKAFHPFSMDEDEDVKDPLMTSGVIQHAYIEPNRDSMNQVLIATHDAVGGVGKSPTLDTSPGLVLSRRIYQTQQQLGLSALVGCSPLDYELDHAMDEDDSLWGLYMYHVIPTMLFTGVTDNTGRIFVQGTGAFRYKLFQGRVVLDDVIAVCPFNDTIYQFSNILTGSELLMVLNVTSSFPNKLNSGPGNTSLLPYLAVSSIEQIDSNRNYSLFTTQFHVAEMTDRIYRVVGKPSPDPEPIPSVQGAPSDFVTTTSLWKSFIEQQWGCTGQELHRTPAPEVSRRPAHVTREERPMTVFVFIVILIVGIFVYQKRKEQLARSGYMPIGDPTTALWRSSSMSMTR